MFFTNGGVGGGTPVWLILGAIYIALILEGKTKYIMLVLNIIVTAVFFHLGYIRPDLVTAFSREGDYFDTFTGLLIVGAVVYSIFSYQNNLFQKEENYGKTGTDAGNDPEGNGKGGNEECFRKI